MLRGNTLREFEELQAQYGCETNNNFKLIQEGVLEYFFPINALSKQKRAMRHAIRKPQNTTFKRFAESLTEMNNFLMLFTGLDDSKKMEMEELNKILLHAVTNGWTKKS